MRKGYYECALLVRLVSALKAVLLEDSLQLFVRSLVLLFARSLVRSYFI